MTQINFKLYLLTLLYFLPIIASADEISAHELLREQNIKIRSELNPQALASFNHQYPDYQISQYCQGAFTKPNTKEYLIATVSKKIPDKIIYFLLLKFEEKNYTIKKIGQDWFIDSSYYVGIGLPAPTIASMYCQNPHETRDMWFFPGEEDWQLGPPSRNLHSFCIQLNDSDYEYSCYQYNIGTKTFPLLYGSFYSSCNE